MINDLSFNNAQLKMTVTEDAQVLGYLVIDSMIGGHAYGGVRIMPDVSEEEMRILAHNMTLKHSFLGLPYGGAKAGILGNPEAPREEKWKRLKAFGKAIAPLLQNRIYVPASDMGTEFLDIQYMLQEAGVRVNQSRATRYWAGYYTALTVFAGIRQAARHLGLKLDQCTAAIEGFGNVGSALAELLNKANVRVVAISTSKGAIYNPQGLNVPRLVQLNQEAGSRVIELYKDAEPIKHSDLLELKVDFLSPCARYHSIHLGNAPRISAKVICAGANNPVAPEAEQILSERGLLCLPDFVTNCGGALGGTMEFAALKKERIKSFVDEYLEERIGEILTESKERKLLPRVIAESFALNRFNEIQRRALRPRPLGKLFEMGLDLYRRGLVPGCLVSSVSPLFFKKILKVKAS